MSRYKTYRFLADSLALDFRSDGRGEIEKVIRSGNINWNNFFRTGSNHLVLQTLYRIYKTHNLTDLLPKDAEAELKMIYDLNQERNSQILKQAVEISRILKDAGMKPVFLKGVGHIMNGIYPDPAERLLADIDILLPKDSLPKAVEVLEQNKYVVPVKYSEANAHIYTKHLPRLYKPGWPAYLELHWEAVKSSYRIDFSCDVLMKQRINSKLYPECSTLSMEAATVHHFIHGQLEHPGQSLARVYLRNMYELMLLSAQTDVSGNLESFGRFTKQSSNYIHLTERVFKVSIASEKQRKKSSRLYQLRHSLNIRYITGSILLQLLNRFYISYIKKSMLIIKNKEVRRKTKEDLSSKAWYRQHFSAYTKLFSSKRKY